MGVPEVEFDKQRLMQLVHARCNGEIADSETQELEDMLVASQAARSEYCQVMKIHAALEWELAGTENWDAAFQRLFSGVQSQGFSRKSSVRVPTGNRQSSLSRSQLLLAFAACLVVGVLIGIRGPWRSAVSRPSNTPTASVDPIRGSALGHLAPLLPNSQWSFGREGGGGSSEVYLGDTLSIDLGAVQLALSNDVVAKMKAPLVLQLVSADQVRLLHGRIQVDVPEGAEGFSIETSAAEIIDLGTSFSVEVADGGTDLIVHQGEVDLKVSEAMTKTENGTRENAVKRFRGGEAVHIDRDGTLSRIVNVNSDDLLSESGTLSEEPIVHSVSDNLSREDIWSFYEIVPGGLNEDVRAFVDRPHEWNGATEKGLPDYLMGADYVKTFNNDKVSSELTIRLGLKVPATVFVFLDKRLTPPNWLLERFHDTGDMIGIDEAHGQDHTFVGPGIGIDETFSVWKFEATKGGVVDLGPNGKPETGADGHVLSILSNMYGIAVAVIDK